MTCELRDTEECSDEAVLGRQAVRVSEAVTLRTAGVTAEPHKDATIKIVLTTLLTVRRDAKMVKFVDCRQTV